MIRSASTKVFSTLLAILLVATALITVIPPVEASAANIVITLDPGHGGSDPGASDPYGGQSEAEYAWSFCTYMKERLLQYSGVTVYFTRAKNENPDLSARAKTAARYNSNAFVSIHCNSASNASAQGTEILIPNSNYRPGIATASKAAAQNVLDKLLAATGNKSRGFLLKNASSTKYPDGSAADYYGIIRNGKLQNIPVVFLVETGFISNSHDYQTTMATDAIRKNVAYAMADGLAQYYGLSGVPSVTPPTVDAALLEVSNDELKYMDAQGNQIGEAFVPGTYESWNHSITIDRASVKTLVDWGWAMFNAGSYQFGYIVNGQEYRFDDAYNALHLTEETVKHHFSANGASGSRFMGQLPTDILNHGANTVEFCVKLNGSKTEVIRRYTVNVTAPSMAHASNDYNACVNASGQVLSYPFTGITGAYYEFWDKKISISADEVDHLEDYGWVALQNADSYQFGYIINNSKEIFNSSFTVAPGDDVKNACSTNHPGATPSRFLGVLPTSELSVGSNNVKFCVRMNGAHTAVIREYTVELRTALVIGNVHDELRLLDANGTEIGQAFTPGQHSSWDKALTIDRANVKTLVDWGWAVFHASSYQYGYIINGQEYRFDDAYNALHLTEETVKYHIYTNAANGSRFMGQLPTEVLTIGQNNVKFCVKLDGNKVEVLSEYTVTVTDSTPAPNQPATPDTSKDGQFWSSIDKINALGPNGATAFYNRGGSSQNGTDTIDAVKENIYIGGTTLTVSGWMALDGGITKYVYTFDGGRTWRDAVGGADGEPRQGYFAQLAINNATSKAMFNMGNAPITIDLSAYPGKTIPAITIAAVSAADGSKVSFLTISNYTVPNPEEATEAPTEDVTETPVEDATEAPAEDVTGALADGETNTPAEDVTDAPVEYVTSEDGAPVTDENGEFIPVEVTASEDATNEEEADDGKLQGCSSVLPSAAIVSVLSALAGAICLRKKKED